MLSHYPSNWAIDQTTADMAMDDWIDFLSSLSRQAIEHACASYLRDQPRVRPTPGDILQRARAFSQEIKRGDKSKLTHDELDLLENKILPTARKCLTIPGLADHGRQTLAHWGEA